MGDLQGGAMEEDRLFPLPSFAAPLCNPDPNSIRVETWVAAEDPAREVLNCIHPTLDSEEKRKDVIEYVQRLIRCSLGLEVFPYGSVPLKTYLPDGDIDLTALSTPNVEESSPRDVLAVLQAEEHNRNAEFELKDTQFIDAEVKLVKCLVQDIVIDISFNQLGGLCTLCFLEQVDRLVGKDHLFKRSIILIKAWCYYESRILGAHHGLISTYALETLVLYIFHVFNPSLNGPIGVLYRFLDYYSKFDWDNYCVSLDGPVCKSSLPNLVVKTPENQGNDVLLKDEFLRNCLDMFTVPSRGLETNVRAFPQKYLNIIDPLKENNNLGRSVHRGNYYRIRSAFRFGARKLGRILQLPSNKIGDEIKKFFTNTLQRHGPKYGPDTALILGTGGLGTLSTSSLGEAYYEDDMYSKFSNGDFDDYLSGMDDISTMGYTDSNDLSLFRSLSLKNGNVKSDSSSRSSQVSHSHSGGDSHTGPPYNGSNFENGYLSEGKTSVSFDGKLGLELWMENGESQLVDGCWCINNNHDNVSDSSSLDFRERVATGSVGGTESLNPLSDLTGDYDSHIRSLLYGQCCHGYALSAAVVRTSPPTSPYENNKTWEAAVPHWSTPFQQNSSSSQVKANDVSMGHTMYVSGSNSTAATAAFGWEERYKARGTGPYFPIVNCSACKERLPRGRGRNRGPPLSNGQLQQPRVGSVETDSVSEVNHNHEGPSPSDRSPRQGRGKAGPSHRQQQPSKLTSTADGIVHSERKLEFGSFGPLPEPPTNAEASQSCVQSSKLVYGRKQERIGEKSFHLKNEDEFPPLSA